MLRPKQLNKYLVNLSNQGKVNLYVTWSALSHYLKQCQNIANLTLDIVNWSIWKCRLEMAAILARPQYVKNEMLSWDGARVLWWEQRQGQVITPTVFVGCNYIPFPWMVSQVYGSNGDSLQYQIVKKHCWKSPKKPWGSSLWSPLLLTWDNFNPNMDM